MSWCEGKAWSDKFIPEISAILGLCLFREPAVIEDQRHNTDIILTADDLRVACRVRRFKDFENYGNEFTVRWRLASGAKTEIDKIMEGWGSYIFYAFCDQQEKGLHQWFIGDLDVFRQCYANKKAMPCDIKPNNDKRSELAAFMIKDFNKEFVVNYGGSYYGRTIESMIHD